MRQNQTFDRALGIRDKNYELRARLAPVRQRSQGAMPVASHFALLIMNQASRVLALKSQGSRTDDLVG